MNSMILKQFIALHHKIIDENQNYIQLNLTLVKSIFLKPLLENIANIK